MSIQGSNDLPARAARCLRCWPTGVACLRFYSILLFSIISVLVAGVYLLAYSGQDGGLDCAMTTILSTTLAFWLTPPSIGPSSAGP